MIPAPHPLDNVFWRCLSGPHAHLSVGNGQARRYRSGHSDIAAFSDTDQPQLDALATHCQAGETFYVAGWKGPNTSSAWCVELDDTMVAMAWAAPEVPGEPALPCLPLQTTHIEAAMDLVALTRPGPFGPLNFSMGEYVGHFGADGQLIAMAGERTRAEHWHEVSGICTHPNHQGRGLGRLLTHEIVRRMLLRNESPYLHVMARNDVARGMYRRLGFQEVLETPIRVIRRV